MAYMSVTGARSTRYPLSGLGCGCTPTSGLGIDGVGSRTGAALAIGAGALGLVYLLSTSKLAMNAARRRVSANAPWYSSKRKTASGARAELAWVRDQMNAAGTKRERRQWAKRETQLLQAIEDRSGREASPRRRTSRRASAPKRRSTQRRASAKRRSTQRRVSAKRVSAPKRRRTSEKNYAYVGYVLYARNVSRLADPFSRLTPAENKALMKRYTTIGAAKQAMARLKKRHGRHLMFELKGLVRAR